MSRRGIDGIKRAGRTSCVDRSVYRLLAVGALVLYGLVALASPVAASADVVASSPTQGAQLAKAPLRANVTFSAAIEPAGSSIVVVDLAGERHDLGDMTLTGGSRPTLSVGLHPEMPPGPYLIEWRALSSDGHSSSGRIGFSIGGGVAPPSESQPLAWGPAIARFVAYMGFSLAFGAAAFLLWMPYSHAPWAPRIALVAGATLHAAGTALLAANTAASTGIPMERFATFEVGQVLLVRLLLAFGAWSLALVWTFRPVRAGPAVVTALLLASALGSARLGHAVNEGSFAVALDLLHLVSAATWIGSLALLLYMVWRAQTHALPWRDLQLAGARFGKLAMACVTILAISGIVLAFDILGWARLANGSLLRAPYAGFLLGKIALAALMVAVASVNRYVLLQDPTETGLAGTLQQAARKVTGGRLAPMSPNGLRRTLAFEAGLGAIVLLLAGLLASTGPPPLDVPAGTEAQLASSVPGDGSPLQRNVLSAAVHDAAAIPIVGLEDAHRS
jgi:copper transport protein